MTNKSSTYDKDYTELKCIGRGNFGSAFLVERNSDKIKAVAKKIMLGQLPEKDQQNALLEVNLLRYLDHPNIVEYIDSYVDKGILVIVMEYWDVGDLSYHIRKKKKAGENFTEDEILNWFVQISMALEYIHGRKVLHRDIKASNIFLTGNNWVKLGDFGISRVLENTCDHAQTVVGTPYYMSPEVCENKPYTFKSDVWALGWVLYELCQLEHAFSADNLLGLVYKIVQDKHEPIPSHYSDELKNIIEWLLIKDESKRPLVSQILMEPFTKSKMEEFISNGGFIGTKKLHVRKVPSHRPQDSNVQSTDVSSMASTMKTKEDEEAKVVKKSNSVVLPEDEEGITPKERLKRRKQRIADEKAQKLMEHTRGAISNYNYAAKRNYEEHNREGTYDSGKIKGGHKSYQEDREMGRFEENKGKYYSTNKPPTSGIAMGDKSKVMISNNFVDDPIKEVSEHSMGSGLGKSEKFADSFGANDRWEDTFAANDRGEDTFFANDRGEDTFAANDRGEDTFAANDRDGTVFRAGPKFDKSLSSGGTGEDTYKLSESNGTMISGLSLEDSVAKTLTKPLQKAVSYDDRKIVSSGKYDPEEYYYNYEAYLSDEFEEDDVINAVKEEAKQDEQELTWIMDNYKNFLNKEADQPSTEVDDEFHRQQSILEEENKNYEEMPIQETAVLMYNNKKNQIEGVLGSKVYSKVYKFLINERKENTPDSQIYKKLRKMIGSDNQKALKVCFDLDQIVFYEIMKGQV